MSQRLSSTLFTLTSTVWTGVVHTRSAHSSVKRLALRYMLMSCKCHIANLEVRHINERQSIIISHRSVLSLTRGPSHLQMLQKVSGEHVTGDSAEALGNICCDTWLLNMCIYTYSPSSSAVGWRRLNHEGMCSLLKCSQCGKILKLDLFWIRWNVSGRLSLFKCCSHCNWDSTWMCCTYKLSAQISFDSGDDETLSKPLLETCTTCSKYCFVSNCAAFFLYEQRIDYLYVSEVSCTDEDGVVHFTFNVFAADFFTFLIYFLHDCRSKELSFS